MRQCFLLLAKIVGLLMAYWTVTDIGNLLFTICSFVVESKSVGNITVLAIGYAVILAIVISISLWLTWLMLVRTEWVADKLGVSCSKEAETTVEFNSNTLVTGIKLIGLYVIVQEGPNMVQQLMDVVWAGYYSFSLEGSIEWRSVLSSFARSIAPILKLGIGVLFIFNTEGVVRFTQTRMRLGGK